MEVRSELIGRLSRSSRAETPRERAASAWEQLCARRSVHTVAALRSDLSRFGRAQWSDSDVVRTIARILEALARDRNALQDLARGHLAAERGRGCAESTLARRWTSFAALARVLGAKLGSRPHDREHASAHAIIARLLAVHDYRAACIVGLAAQTRLRREQIAAMRVHELATRSGSADLRRAIVEYTHGRSASAWAFEGRERGSSCTAQTIDRVCEKAGTTFAALRRGKGAA